MRKGRLRSDIGDIGFAIARDCIERDPMSRDLSAFSVFTFSLNLKILGRRALVMKR